MHIIGINVVNATFDEVKIVCFMKKFSQMVMESPKSSEEILVADITNYINRVKKVLSIDVQKAIYLTAKYNITSAEELDKIRTATKSKLKSLAEDFNMPQPDMEDLWNLMKSMKNNYRQMPQYMSKTERDMIEAGKLSMDDLTIDLKSVQGRNAAAKIFTPTVLKIVSQELPKHPNMSRSEMISSGMLGLSNAMNDWKPEPDTPGGKVVPFRTYASYRILQQILNDANSVHQALSGRNAYNIKKDSEKYGSAILRTMSLDGLTRDREDDDFSQDHIAALATADRPSSADEEKKWNQIFRSLEQRFTQKDMDIFYRYFGVNGRKRETGVQLAKDYNTTAQNIQNSYLSKILKYIKKTPALKNILSDLQDIYSESLLAGLLDMTKQQILEVLAADDIYILLTESTKWDNRNTFVSHLEHALQSFKMSDKTYKILLDIIFGDFEEVDSRIRKNDRLIRSFLSLMHPTRNFHNGTDGDLIEGVMEIQEYCHKYKLDPGYFQK